MVTYQVTAPDGKKYRITADNEDKAQEAVTQFQSQYSQPDPGGEDGSFIRGAISAVPGARAATEGGYQGTTAEKIGQASGDIGGAAGLGALGLSAGAAPAALALGTGALVSGAMEATGANKALQREADMIRAKGEVGIPGTDIDYKFDPDPQSQSVARNFLELAKGEVPATLVELSPILASMVGAGLAKAGLAGAKGMGQKALQRGTAVDPSVEARTAFSQREGIPLTRGEVEGVASRAAVKEAGLRRTSGGEGAAQKMAGKQQEAVREALAKQAESVGDVELAAEIRRGQMTEGRQLADIPEKAKALRSEAGAAVGEAKEALRGKIPIRSNFANELTGEIDGVLKTLSKASKGSDRAVARELLDNFKEQAKGVKTMADAIEFLDDFDSAIKSTMTKAKPDVKKVAFGGLRKKVLGVLDEAAEKLAPEQQAALKKAKAGFAEVADPAFKLGKGMEDINASSLLKKITSGQKSQKMVEDFQRVFKKGTPERTDLQSSVFQDIVKKATGRGGEPTGAGMVKALDKMDQATLKAVFSDNPKALQGLRQFADDLANVEAQRTPLGILASGGSQTAPLLNVLKSVSGLGTAGVMPWVMEKLAEYRSTRAFRPYTPKAPSNRISSALSKIPEVGGSMGSIAPVAGALTAKGIEQGKLLR